MRHLAYNNEQPFKIQSQGVKMGLRGDREATKWKNKLHPFSIYNLQYSIMLNKSH